MTLIRSDPFGFTRLNLTMKGLAYRWRRSRRRGCLKVRWLGSCFVPNRVCWDRSRPLCQGHQGFFQEPAWSWLKRYQLHIARRFDSSAMRYPRTFCLSYVWGSSRTRPPIQLDFLCNSWARSTVPLEIPACNETPSPPPKYSSAVWKSLWNDPSCISSSSKWTSYW